MATKPKQPGKQGRGKAKAQPTAPKQATPKGGRPTKFTPEVREKLLTALRSGNTYEASAGYAGISYDCLRNWMKEGQTVANGEFFEFFQSVKKAEADAEAESIGRIRRAAAGQKVLISETTRVTPTGEQVIDRKYQFNPPQWQADAWYLERRRPTDWGRRDRLKVENDPIEWEDVPDDVLDQYVDGKITEDDVRRAIVARTRKG